MALRHPFPDTVLADLSRSSEPTQTVPVLRKAKLIEFRRGKDVAEVVKEMVGYSRVQVNAAVGSGKSTLLPAELVRQAKKPVFHIVPSRCLAVHLYDYVSKITTDVPVSLALEPADLFETQGVTITYMANLTAIVLSKTIEAAFVEYTEGAYLYLDESHESDGYTKFVQKLGHKVAGIECVIEATATPSADRMQMPELPGDCRSEVFASSEAPATWDPSDAGKPWSISSFDNNVLVYLDNPRLAGQLVEKFARGGVTAYRLSARMPVDAFRRAFAQLTDPKSGIIVLVADYSFRSGFTFPVDRIIDSAVVEYHTIEGSQQIVKTRYAYRLERYQAQHRGGRIPGSVCTYFSPNIEQPNAICDLEGIETELAAALFRFAGYRPPVELSIAMMAVGNVPCDLVKAANGSVAFPLLSQDELMPLVREVTGEKMSNAMEEILGEYAQEEPKSPLVDYFAGMSTDERPLPVVGQDSLLFLQQLKLMSGASSTLMAGRYYKTAGVPNEVVETQLYGTDWRQALLELQEKPWLISGFTRTQRVELIALFLAEYNTQVATAAGINVMLEAQESLTILSTRFPDYVREWSDYVSSALRQAKSMQTAFIEVLDKLRLPGMEFMPIMPDIDMEKRISKAYADRLINAVKGVDRVIDGPEYLKYIEGKVSEVEPPPERSYDKLSIESERGRQSIRVYCTPGKLGGKSVWDLKILVPAGLMWTDGDCEEALRFYLSTVGMSARMLRTVEFVGIRVSSSRILRNLVDSGDFKHRQALTHKFTMQEMDKGGGMGKIIAGPDSSDERVQLSRVRRKSHSKTYAK